MKSDEKRTIKKWYTKSVYVDTETGEIISKSKYEREYIKVRTVKKTEINETYGIIEYTNECEKNRQQKLFE